MPIMVHQKNTYKINSNLPTSMLCSPRMFGLTCPRQPFALLLVALGLELKDQLLCFNSVVTVSFTFSLHETWMSTTDQ